MEEQTGAEPSKAVWALEQLPEGTIYDLWGCAKAPGRVFVLRVGKGSHNDIIIRGDESVEDTHCLLVCKGGQVRVERFEGETQIGDVPVVDAQLELDQVLTVGNTLLMARGGDRHALRKPKMSVQDYPGLVLKWARYFASQADAAEAFGIKERTFNRHLSKFASAALVMCGLVGGGLWLAPDSERKPSSPAMVTPATLAPAANGAVEAAPRGDDQGRPRTKAPSFTKQHRSEAVRAPERVANPPEKRTRSRAKQRRRARDKKLSSSSNSVTAPVEPETKPISKAPPATMQHEPKDDSANNAKEDEADESRSSARKTPDWVKSGVYVPVEPSGFLSGETETKWVRQ